MAGTLWTIEYFSCPNCGLPYTATREQHPYKHSGSFSCEVCGGNRNLGECPGHEAIDPRFAVLADLLPELPDID